MKRVMQALGLVALGAAIGMLFAPATGRRTRALIRDKATRASHQVARYTSGTAKHLGNKAKGYYHEAIGLVRRRSAQAAEAAAEEERAA